MRKITISIFVMTLLAATGCRKFVTDTPVTNVRTLSTTNDYRLLLNNVGASSGSVETSLYTYPVLSGDDVYFTDSTYQANYSTYYQPIYTWASLYHDASASDLNWEAPYAAIYTFNTVISSVLTSTGGTDSLKHELMAEALLNRSFSYWALVNCYAKQYDSATASSDLGVPLLLVPDLNAKLTRESVKTVYDQVISDVKQAIPSLPSVNINNIMPSKLGAYALLSRVYLFTRNFGQASLYADSAMAIKNTIQDYNSYAGGTTYPVRINHPEIIFSKMQTGSFSPLQLNPSLVTLLGTKDLRYQLFTRSGTNYSNTWPTATRIYWLSYNLTGEANNIGLTTPELYLIKAECLARAGNVSSAMTYLNQLRTKRYAPADYIAATASTAADALQLVVDERKKEFFGRGLRWFDQKRLNKDNQFAANVTRVFQGVTYTLTPSDNRYVYPIGEKYITLNPEITQNP